MRTIAGGLGCILVNNPSGFAFAEDPDATSTLNVDLMGAVRTSANVTGACIVVDGAQRKANL